MSARNNSTVILLADDDEDDQMLAADALRELKLANELRTVNDGEDLMDYLNHRGKHALPASAPRPDLVLLDLNMPKKDGREALREMKADPGLRSIPVVVLTTSKAEEDLVRIYHLGANSYIVKPTTFDDFVRVMRVAAEYWLRVVRLPAYGRISKHG